ncbi:hypothetical protein [Spirosoma sp. KUDC1026]|uniref:hypothetical protein n=1 Tax=Spirosoma sp. KUDC1026 TaxID=2745947 RepID=UPI00159B8DF1|nr:hypothetical protein [Spirosoma sp. KUDC1026]QKZ14258.1 hypothetical protein HU175_17140 [Spirosoma sp. KUDC1026]
MKKILVIGITILVTGCTTGIRDLDLENKQFEATYNVDSTRGLDSADRARFQLTKTIYSFGENGVGTKHAQVGMLSTDSTFKWAIEGDKGESLRINKDRYLVKEQSKGYRLMTDSTMLILRLQNP